MNLESLLNIFGNQKEGEFEPSVNEGSSEKKNHSDDHKNEIQNPQKEKEKQALLNLQNGVVKSMVELDEGTVNSVFLVEFTNGTSGIFKPASGESAMRKIEHGTLFKRERAAYLVNAEMNFGFVPPTIIRKINGQIGSLQLFIPDTLPYYEIRREEISRKEHIQNQLKTFWVYDPLIHNSDRHMGNILCEKVDGNFNLHAIDNAASFCKSELRFDVGNFFDQELPEDLGEKISNLRKNQLLREKLRALLLELLNKKEVEAFFARVNLIGDTIDECNSIPRSRYDTITNI